MQYGRDRLALDAFFYGKSFWVTFCIVFCVFGWVLRTDSRTNWTWKEQNFEKKENIQTYSGSLDTIEYD